MSQLTKAKTQPQQDILPPSYQAEIDRIFKAQQAYRFTLAKSTATQRIRKLRKLLDLVMAKKAEIREALYKDFRKNPSEVDLTETMVVTSEIKHALGHLRKWTSPHKVPTPMALLGTKSQIVYEPKGNVLIISPWNYPLNLTLGPLTSAIAAGNTVIIKPSEYTPHTSALMKEMLSQIFEEKEVAMFEGDHRVGEYLINQPFHHIFFTGSPQIGKVVMKAAAQHLSSVTLELGGKCPVIVDETANIDEAAHKIAWGKFVNKGQTCLAPDYVFVHKKHKEKFLALLEKHVQKLYGATEEDRKDSTCYARIINEKHFSRLNHLLETAKESGANIQFGGFVDSKELYISPTVLTQVSLESPIMQEEIFGPLLPVLEYENLDEPINLINSKDKPLALYVYSKRNRNVDRILNSTSSGGACVNDNVIHFFQTYLPFGGVNTSGIGESHGFFGFKSFSNAKSVLKQPLKLSATTFLYPPYNKTVQKMIDLALRWF